MAGKANDTGWLQERIRVTQWDIEQPYKEYDLTPIHSLAVDGNEKFIQLKSTIASYNSQVQSLGQKKKGMIHGGVKWHFAATLYSMLRDITQTKDTDVQKRYLDDVYEWASNYQFNKRTRPLTATTRPTTAFTRPATGKTITNMRRKLLNMKSQDLQLSEMNDEMGDKEEFENIMVNHKQSTATDKPKVPSHEVTQQMQAIRDEQKDYRYQHRTSYSEIQAPGQRLKQFPRRKRLDLQLQKPLAPLTTIKTRITTEEVFNDNIANHIEDIDMNKQEEIDEGELFDEGGVQGDIPEIDFGAGQADEQGEVEEAEQEQEIVDKLGPRIKVYKDFELYVHDETVKVSQNRNFKKKNRDVQNGIIDKQSTNMVQQDWVRAKSRWKNEQFRRLEASKIVRSVSAVVREKYPQNVVDLTNVKQRPASSVRKSFLKDTQKDQKESHLRNVIQYQLKNIRLGEAEPLTKTDHSNQSSNKPRCLSAFVPSSATKKVQFSDLLSRGRDMIYNELDAEMIEIKERLAGYRIPLDISKLKSGVSLESEQMKMLWEQGSFPVISGKMMLHNPYFKVGKKKKKKKKK